MFLAIIIPIFLHRILKCCIFAELNGNAYGTGIWKMVNGPKYILTALLLATFLGDMNSAGTIVASIILMLGMLGIGLWLVRKSNDNNNIKKKGK